ncbi:ABC-type transport auxiliary lipoprotein family protein [Wohlfahrtiimonas larvae]|uniref:ABC-type transport auxiliary lipoprotein component domain-containing protein n=1 Tax=Wohlfahrtiimonas larvae TaxID=1157986 RepID=A0ABP9MF33_9GAMM|nr:ABC-type transport auxiliary lipoprotein family protein [Wohlfahrtiimonas larvae]
MKIKLMSLAAVAVMVVGCQSAPYKTQYTLATDTVSEAVPTMRTKPYAILVDDVKTLASGRDVDMTYSRTANVIESYTQSQWAKPPKQQIQVAIVNALIASHGYRDVLSAPTAISSQYKIDTTIQKMQQYFDGNQGYVELSLMVRLLNSSTNQVVFSKIYSAKEPVDSLNAQGGVEAYNQALKRLLPDMIRDIHKR